MPSEFPQLQEYQEVRYAGFWVRFIASLIDSLVLLIPSFLLKMVFDPESATFYYFYAYAFMTFSYRIFTTSSSWQGTVGKKLLGLKVVDGDGKRISIKRSFGRALGNVISTIILFIGYLMIGLNKKKRGLHDMIAGTYVIKA